MNSVMENIGDANRIRNYELKIISDGLIGLFLPLSYMIEPPKEDDKDDHNREVIICSDVSNVEPVPFELDGGEAPYIASDIISGMEDAMNHYALPWHYDISSNSLYVTKDKKYKIAYSPTIGSKGDIDVPGRVFRLKCSKLMKELFASETETIPGKRVILREIVDAVVEVLNDESISLETCKRRIEKIKEDAFFIRPDRRFESLEVLDFSEEIV